MKNFFNSLFILSSLLIISSSCQTKHEEQTFKIGYSKCVGEEWTPAIGRGIYKTMEIQEGCMVELLTKDVNFSSEQQIEDVKLLVDQGIDLLIISPNETFGIERLIDSLYNTGLPVIVTDRKISSDNFTAYFGADNYLLGRKMAAVIKEVADTNQVIIEMTGQQSTSSPSIERHRGFEDEMEGSLLNILTIQGDWREKSAFEKMDSVINRGIDPDIVCSHNDFMAVGIYNALQKHQKKSIITGVDASEVGMRMVSEGKLLSTFVYPESLEFALSLAVRILRKEGFEKYNYLEALNVDKQNVRTLLLQKEIINGQLAKINRQKQYEVYLSNLIRKTKLINFVSLAVIFLFIAVLIYIYILLKQKSKINAKLEQKSILIEKKNKEIFSQKENLLKMTKIAEEASDSKMRFFTDISHEFKTLLSLISFPTQEILKNNITEDERKYQVERIDKNLKKLTKLTEDLLSFRLIDKHKYTLKIETHNISKIVEEIANDFEIEAIRKNLDFNIKIKQDIVANIDKHAFEKVTYNLISNAIKYTNEGGVKISLDTTDTELKLEITDTGIGIPKEEQSLVFNRFYRSKLKNTKFINGTGIGLSLSNELIKLQNGYISLISDKGIGSTFSVTIPLKLNSLTIEADHNWENSSNLKNKKVLLVEDNHDMSHMLVEKLSLNFNVRAVENGQEALDSITEETPDIIISDILMPVMDGLELCTNIKRTTDIPIILITALDTPKDTILGFNLGADAYITKPFSVDVLISRIINILKNTEKLKIKGKFINYNEFTKDKTEKDIEFINNCIQLICDADKHKKVTVKEIANKLNVSYFTLSSRVKDITGMKVNEFFRKARLDYAAQLLLKTDMQVNEVAWEVGFDDQKYFRECFKQQFGNNPSEFRGL